MNPLPRSHNCCNLRGWARLIRNGDILVIYFGYNSHLVPMMVGSRLVQEEDNITFNWRILPVQFHSFELEQPLQIAGRKYFIESV